MEKKKDLTAGTRYKTSCTAHYHLTQISHFQFSKVISDATNYAARAWTPQSTEVMEAAKKPNLLQLKILRSDSTAVVAHLNKENC